MLNITQYSNKTEMIKSKLRAIDEKAIEMYDSGEFSVKEIEFFLKSSISQALLNLSKPSFQRREALTVPIFEDYESMMKESIQDLRGLLQDCLTLETSLKDLSKKNNLMKKIIWNRISLIKKTIESIFSSLSLEEISGNKWSFNETFASNEYMEFGDSSIDILSGILTLKETKNEKIKNMSIKIHEDSNGFPGNTHEATQNRGEVVFKGEGGIHADLNDIMDEKDSSWFEYEVFSVNPELLSKIGVDGFEYQEGVSWITDQKEMSLKMTVTLDKETVANKLSLKPFLVNSFGTEPARIRYIKVFSEDKKRSAIISAEENFSEDKVYLFKELPVKTIEMEFVSEDPYDTKIGHYFFGSEQTEEIVRTKGSNLSVSLLGFKYAGKEGKLTPPSSHDEEGKPLIPDENKMKEEFFGLHLREENCHREILDGKRFMIGIKELFLSKTEYAQSSSYVSKDIVVKDKISSISLESDDYVPKSFGVEANYLKYYISLDDGKEWLPIFPKHRNHNGPSTYRINSLLSDPAKGNAKLLYRLEDCYKVKVKIEMSRPSLQNGETPVVRNYKIKIQMGDEMID